jgi:hypothetical protein
MTVHNGRRCKFNGSLECGHRICPLNRPRFIEATGAWLNVPMSMSEEQLVFRCDVALCFTSTALVELYYGTGKVTYNVCNEFSQAYRSFQSRMDARSKVNA